MTDQIAIRLSVLDGEQVRAQLAGIGEAGDQSLRRIADAGPPAAQALTEVGAAAQAAGKALLQDLAAAATVGDRELTALAERHRQSINSWRQGNREIGQAIEGFHRENAALSRGLLDQEKRFAEDGFKARLELTRKFWDENSRITDEGGKRSIDLLRDAQEEQKRLIETEARDMLERRRQILAEFQPASRDDLARKYIAPAIGYDDAATDDLFYGVKTPLFHEGRNVAFNRKLEQSGYGQGLETWQEQVLHGLGDLGGFGTGFSQTAQSIEDAVSGALTKAKDALSGLAAGGLSLLGSQGQTGADGLKQVAESADATSDSVARLNRTVETQAVVGLGQLASRSGLAGQMLSTLGATGVTVAAGLGALVVAFELLDRQARESERDLELIDQRLRLTGQAGRIALDDVNRLTSALGVTGTQSDHEIRQTIAALVELGAVPAPHLQQTLSLAQRLAQVLGFELKDAALILAKAWDSPVQALDAVNAKTRLFTAVQRDQVEEMVKSGREWDAAGVVFETLGASLEGVTVRTDAWAEAVHRIDRAWKTFVDTLGWTGPSLAQQLDDVITLGGKAGANLLDKMSKWVSGDELEQQIAAKERAIAAMAAKFTAAKGLMVDGKETELSPGSTRAMSDRELADAKSALLQLKQEYDDLRRKREDVGRVPAASTTPTAVGGDDGGHSAAAAIAITAGTNDRATQKLIETARTERKRADDRLLDELAKLDQEEEREIDLILNRAAQGADPVQADQAVQQVRRRFAAERFTRSRDEEGKQLDQAAREREREAEQAQREAERAAEQAAREAEQEAERRQRASEAIDKQIDALARERQQLALSADERAASIVMLRAEDTAREAGIALTEEQTQRLKEESAALQQARQLDKLRSEAQSLHQSLRTPAEIYSDAASKYADMLRKGLLSQQDYERASGKAFDDFQRATNKSKDDADQANTLMRDLARTMGQSLGRAFDDLIMKGAKFSDVLKQVEQDLIRVLSQKLVMDPLQSWFEDKAGSLFSGKGGGGGMLSGGGLMNLFDSGSFWTDLGWVGNGIGVFHQGGVVGEDLVPTRPLPAHLFLGAPRYHSGGVVGLGPDEVPIIAQRGERILSRDQAAARPGYVNNPVTVTMNITSPDAGSFRASRDQIGAELAAAMRRAQRNL